MVIYLVEFKKGDKVRIIHNFDPTYHSNTQYNGEIVTYDAFLNTANYPHIVIFKNGEKLAVHEVELAKEDFKNIKIRVRNPAESEAVQKKLFELGYKWCDQDTKIKHTDTMRYLFVEEFDFYYRDASFYEEEYFNDQKMREVTVEELLGKPGLRGYSATNVIVDEISSFHQAEKLANEILHRSYVPKQILGINPEEETTMELKNIKTVNKKEAKKQFDKENKNAEIEQGLRILRESTDYVNQLDREIKAKEELKKPHLEIIKQFGG